MIVKLAYTVSNNYGPKPKVVRKGLLELGEEVSLGTDCDDMVEVYLGAGLVLTFKVSEWGDVKLEKKGV